MYKTFSFYYTPPNKQIESFLKFLCHIAKNLYNATLYYLRNNYFKKLKTPTSYELSQHMKSNPNYQILDLWVSIGIVTSALKGFNNFLKSCSKIPKYLPKQGYFPLITSKVNKVISNQNNIIKLPLSYQTESNRTFNIAYDDPLISNFINELHIKKSINVFFKIPAYINHKKINIFKVVPLLNGKKYMIQLTYSDTSVDKLSTCTEQNYMAIDLGVNNLATFIITNKNYSGIIDGRYLKSINQFYNKQLSFLQARKPNQKILTTREELIILKRNRRINDYIYKAARYIINQALKLNVTEIIIGWINNFKNFNLSNKSTNQMFKEIPLVRFKNQLRYLCSLYNITYCEVDESYTSLCSFYDNELVKKHPTYLGKRIKRGLFLTHNNKIVNADINGALNILKKSKTELKSLFTLLRNRGLAKPKRVSSQEILG